MPNTSVEPGKGALKTCTRKSNVESAGSSAVTVHREGLGRDHKATSGTKWELRNPRCWVQTLLKGWAFKEETGNRRGASQRDAGSRGRNVGDLSGFKSSMPKKVRH